MFLDMILKRREDWQAETGSNPRRACRVAGGTGGNQGKDATVARTMIGIQREVASLKERITVLTIAVDEHPAAHV